MKCYQGKFEIVLSWFCLIWLGFTLWYSNGVGNAIEENTSVFSLVWMC